MELLMFYRRILLSTGGFVISLLLTVNTIHAQKEDRVWCIGDSLGVNLNDLDKPVLFKNLTSGRVYNKVAIRNRASIADSSGRLLCYLNSAHTIIPCSDSLWCYAYGAIIDAENKLFLNGDSLFSEYNPPQSTSAFINVDDKSYLFIHTGISPQERDSIENNFGDNMQNIYYSIINMREKRIIKKNVLVCKNVDAGLAVVKHADGKNWWILTRKTRSDSFLVFQTEGDRIISVPVISRGKGVKGTGFSSCSRCSYFSIDSLGKNVMHAFGEYTDDIPANLIQHFNFFSFNRSNGKLLLKKEYQNPANFLMNAILSPNGVYLYVFDRGLEIISLGYPFDTLFQVSLDTMNMSFSDTTIISIMPNNLIHGITTGLDGKIYFLMNMYAYDNHVKYQDSSAYLSIIHQPNKHGISCDYKDRAIFLGKKLDVFGLPYFPNYHLKAEPNYVSPLMTRNKIKIYPNPAQDFVHIQYEMPDTRHQKMEIYNVSGVKIAEYVIKQESGLEKINTENWIEGIYLFKLINPNKNSYFATKIIIAR